MSKRLLFMDVETGGLDPEKHSLLTIALSVYEDGKIINKKDFAVRHDVYNVSAQALKINNINLIEHHDIATDEAIVVDEIIKIIKDNFIDCEPIVAGHGVDFDYKFIAKLFRDNNYNFSDYVSHRKLDTCSILKFLMVTDSIDIRSASLENAIKYFGIETKDRHTARDDVDATVVLFERLDKLINEDNK